MTTITDTKAEAFDDILALMNRTEHWSSDTLMEIWTIADNAGFVCKNNFFSPGPPVKPKLSAETMVELRRAHHVEDGDCWFSCPESGGCCDHSKKGCNCGATTWNAKLDEYIVAWQTETDKARSALRDALSDFEWAERTLPGTNFQASILKIKEALS